MLNDMPFSVVSDGGKLYSDSPKNNLLLGKARDYFFNKSIINGGT